MIFIYTYIKIYLKKSLDRIGSGTFALPTSYMTVDVLMLTFERFYNSGNIDRLTC